MTDTPASSKSDFTAAGQTVNKTIKSQGIAFILKVRPPEAGQNASIIMVASTQRDDLVIPKDACYTGTEWDECKITAAKRIMQTMRMELAILYDVQLIIDGSMPAVSITALSASLTLSNAMNQLADYLTQLDHRSVAAGPMATWSNRAVESRSALSRHLSDENKIDMAAILVQLFPDAPSEARARALRQIVETLEKNVDVPRSLKNK